LFWSKHLLVDVQAVTDRYIDVHVRVAPDEPLWRLTCVYGEPRVENRHQMWSSLRDLKVLSYLPWCVLGDFNEPMWSFEHFSATARGEQQMIAFRDTLEVCELVDLGFSGVPYTYDNKRRGRGNVKVRLDRAVASNEWRNIFAEATVVHLVSPCSDHTPILLKCQKEEGMQYRPVHNHYEIMWERDASLPERVAKAWADAGPKQNLGDIRNGLGKVMGHLNAWSKTAFGSVVKEIEKSRTRLEELMLMNADRQEIREVTDRMNELLYREEMMWLQRSRITWLREGDRNTKFFHRKAVWRARKNKIKGFQDDEGVWHTNGDHMKTMATEYFQNIFSADPDILPEHVLNLFEEKVTADMNIKLCADFTDKEIGDALFQIGPLKAP
jgi:hypothetical protein